MLHKPLFQNNCGDVAPHIRYVPLGPRHRLLDLVAALDLRIVLSGHVHQYLDRIIDGVRHVWVPSTAFFLPDSIQQRVGEKITGLGLLELSSEGCRFDLVCPEGLARNNLLEQPFYAAAQSDEVARAAAAEERTTEACDLSEETPKSAKTF